jgi:hypothetical protein
MYVIFNSTVYLHLRNPGRGALGRDNIDRVHGLVFITYRTAILDKQWR